MSRPHGRGEPRKPTAIDIKCGHYRHPRLQIIDIDPVCDCRSGRRACHPHQT